MPHATPAPRGRQAPRLADDLAQAPGLPFADLLPTESVAPALAGGAVPSPHRLSRPLAPLWVSPPQALAPDGSCRAAPPRSLAWRAARGLPPCSADTSAYCKARGRLPEGLLARLTRD